MPPLTEHVVLRDLDIPNIADFSVYIQNGGYEALRTAVTEKTPNDIVEQVKAAGLRGRGGAGRLDAGLASGAGHGAQFAAGGAERSTSGTQAADLGHACG